MNTLGIAYSSSSDEEAEDAPRATPAKPAAASPTDRPPVKATIACDAVLFNPELNAAPAGMFTDESDEEAMLLRAGIPPAANPLIADKDTQQRIERFLRVQHDRGQDFQTTLQGKKEVRNPYILEKVVEYFDIDELHSNFAPDVFDPHGLSLHEYADALALEQKKRADAQAQRLQQQKSAGTDHRPIQFVSSTRKGR